jgi:hypothetical protein
LLDKEQHNSQKPFYLGYRYVLLIRSTYR